jgi:septum site-determining protein MinC
MTPAVTAPLDEGVLGLTAVDGVLLLTLDTKASFEALREAVRETFSATPDRFRGKDARLDFGTRAIDLFDLRRLVHVLKDEFGVSVTGLYCLQESLVRYAERELKLRVYPRLPEIEVEVQPDLIEEAEIVQEVTPEPAEAEVEELPERLDEGSRTMVIERGLRSGQVIRYGGNVMVYGDVNPGAEVVAGGNVLVFGRLEGTVHAGSEGDDNAHILAFDLRPSQLRVGRKIAFNPETANAPGPELAWVEGGDIRIEPYVGRLPR